MPTQSHIHLSTTIGGAPENAPDKKWKALERVLVPTIIGSHERTLSGHFRFYNAVDGTGNPVRPVSHLYKIIIRDEYGQDIEARLQALLSMYGKVVYLVDHKHADDNNDHASDVKTMYLSDVGQIVPVSVGVTRYEVEITLEDASRM